MLALGIRHKPSRMACSCLTSRGKASAYRNLRFTKFGAITSAVTAKHKDVCGDGSCARTLSAKAMALTTCSASPASASVWALVVEDISKWWKAAAAAEPGSDAPGP